MTDPGNNRIITSTGAVDWCAEELCYSYNEVRLTLRSLFEIDSFGVAHSYVNIFCERQTLQPPCVMGGLKRHATMTPEWSNCARRLPTGAAPAPKEWKSAAATTPGQATAPPRAFRRRHRRILRPIRRRHRRGFRPIRRRHRRGLRPCPPCAIGRPKRHASTKPWRSYRARLMRTAVALALKDRKNAVETITMTGVVIALLCAVVQMNSPATMMTGNPTHVYPTLVHALCTSKKGKWPNH
jgi:hypothetical protein